MKIVYLNNFTKFNWGLSLYSDKIQLSSYLSGQDS